MNLATENSPKTFISDAIYKSKSIHKIKTLMYETEALFDIQNLKYELFRNLYLYYHQIYRIKGYVLNSKKEVFLVQTTGKTVEINPVENQKITKSQLVFIGKELELKSIERLLKSSIIKKKKFQSV
ncbi:GTP-binding protein [Flavobacterium magnesitis]|uniref:GTP-binding protein n=1 Tax=Flavobacterium magnesitis TaxID=3138077 RepID=UPI00358F3B22